MSKEIKVGDKVRSFDFAMGQFGRELTGRRASFVEGEVTEIGDSPVCAGGCPHFHIKVTREVSGGIENFHRARLIGEMVFPHVHGDFGRASVEAV